MNDGDFRKSIDPVARPTARDALVYADAQHGHCTVIAKSVRKPESSQVTFLCACGHKYIIGANRFSKDALRNVLEDKGL